MVAYELFCYPSLRSEMKRSFLEKAKISTQPKRGDLHASRINIYNPNYIVKRIKNKPLSKIYGI
jgi:hypothetical protein